MISVTDLSDLSDLISLSLLPPRTWRDAGERLRRGASPAIALTELLDRRGGAAARATLDQRARAATRRAIDGGMTPLPFSHPSYPAALAAIIDPPFVLWTRGEVTALERPAVALVGSRAASPHALAVAERLGADLAARGVLVVSGLARGVDSAAHRGALAGGGSTVAVLGSGADVIYPPEHAALAREIEVTGLVISELLPGTRPLPLFFPLRNRIISGLSRAVVVIEAGETSGSLITARLALDQGREVLAVPGNVLGGRNRGAHALLRDGAKIVEDADDILEALDLPAREAVRRLPPDSPDGPDSDAERGTAACTGDPVLASLTPGEPADLDAIAERSGVAPARLLPRLFELELKGLVARAGGGRFVRS
jgi:DNA processing protein